MACLRPTTVVSVVLSLSTISFASNSAAETQVTQSWQQTELPAPISSEFQSINEDIIDEIIKPTVIHDNVVLQALDKVTGRVKTINAKIGTKIAFGTLFITAQQCLKTLPEDVPEAAVYLTIEEDNPSAPTSHKSIIFQAWMLASNPSLSALEHPVYDIWIKDCANESADNNLDYKPNVDVAIPVTDNIVAPSTLISDKNTSALISDDIVVEDIQDDPPFMSAEPEQE